MLIFQCENEPVDLISAGLHASVNQFTDTVQIPGSDLQNISGGVAGYFRLAALRITVIGIQRVSGGFDLVASAEEILDLRQHTAKFLGVFFGCIRRSAGLRENADIDLRLVWLCGD